MNTTTQQARILIADEHDLLREGLRAVLEGELDFKVVGEAKDGCEVLRLCRKLRPDVVLMDLRMRCADGLEVTRTIREELPSTAVVIVTLLEPADYFLEAIKAGAADYVLKDAPHHELVATVRRALSDGKKFPDYIDGWCMDLPTDLPIILARTEERMSLLLCHMFASGLPRRVAGGDEHHLGARQERMAVTAESTLGSRYASQEGKST